MAIAKGIDISKWQVATPSLKGRSFVVARATWQTTKDIRYEKHAKNVLAAGKVLGAYHFGTGDATATAQAKAFLRAAGDKSSFLNLDLEKNKAGTNMSKAKAKAFITKVKALDPLKRKIGLYASDGRWPGQIGQDFNWVAKWSETEPARPYKLWQYRGSPLDLDQFNGTIAQMKNYLKMPTTPDVPDVPDPVEPEVPEPTFTLSELEAAVAEVQDAMRAELDAAQAKIAAALVNINEALADLA